MVSEAAPALGARPQGPDRRGRVVRRRAHEGQCVERRAPLAEGVSDSRDCIGALPSLADVSLTGVLVPSVTHQRSVDQVGRPWRVDGAEVRVSRTRAAENAPSTLDQGERRSSASVEHVSDSHDGIGATPSLADVSLTGVVVPRGDAHAGGRQRAHTLSSSLLIPLSVASCC